MKNLQMFSLANSNWKFLYINTIKNEKELFSQLTTFEQSIINRMIKTDYLQKQDDLYSYSNATLLKNVTKEENQKIQEKYSKHFYYDYNKKEDTNIFIWFCLNVWYNSDPENSQRDQYSTDIIYKIKKRIKRSKIPKYKLLNVSKFTKETFNNFWNDIYKYDNLTFINNITMNVKKGSYLFIKDPLLIKIDNFITKIIELNKIVIEKYYYKNLNVGKLKGLDSFSELRFYRIEKIKDLLNSENDNNRYDSLNLIYLFNKNIYSDNSYKQKIINHIDEIIWDETVIKKYVNSFTFASLQEIIPILFSKEKNKILLLKCLYLLNEDIFTEHAKSFYQFFDKTNYNQEILIYNYISYLIYQYYYNNNK